MPTSRKTKTNWRAAPSTLTSEQRCIFTLGKVAERFLTADREAREIRRRRDFLRERVHYVHDDSTPCYLVGVNKHNFDWYEN